MPFSIFRLRTLRGANIVGLLIGMSLFSMFFFISLYLQDVLGYSPIKTGISYLPLAVGIILSAGGASQARHPRRLQAALIAGLLAHRRRPAVVRAGPGPGGPTSADVLGPVAARGRRPGLRVRARHDRGRDRDASPHEAGLASGLINTSQQIGGALGLAILATVANSRTQSLLHAGVHNAGGRADQGLRPRISGRRRLRRRSARSSPRS